MGDEKQLLWELRLEDEQELACARGEQQDEQAGRRCGEP